MPAEFKSSEYSEAESDTTLDCELMARFSNPYVKLKLFKLFDLSGCWFPFSFDSSELIYPLVDPVSL